MSANWSRCLRTVRSQHGFLPLKVEGRIPEELRGTLYRIGVGRFEVAGRPIHHWFDGDGMAVGVRFDRGTAQGAVRVFDTTSPSDEARSGRFGFAPPSLLARLRSTWDRHVYANLANTSPMEWQGRLFALYEGSAPSEFDRDSLAFLGDRDLGIVRRAFSAHPKWVPSRRAHINFGFRILPRPSLDLYELPAAGTPRCLGSVPYNGASFVHDFMVTGNFAAFLVSPAFLSPWGLVVQGKTLADGIVWKPGVGTQVIVCKLDNPSEFWTAKTDPFFVGHFANGFEKDGHLHVDFVASDGPEGLDWIRKALTGHLPRGGQQATLRRAVIHPTRRTVVISGLGREHCELPTVARGAINREYLFVYSPGFCDQDDTKLYDALLKTNVQTREVSRVDFGGDTVSEAVFVGRKEASNEDDGYLLTLNYNATSDQTYCAILDARDRPQEIARAWFDQGLPFTFHGLFSSTL